MSLEFPGDNSCYVDSLTDTLQFAVPISWSCWIIPDTITTTRGVNYFGQNSGFMFYLYGTTGKMRAYVRTTSNTWIYAESAALTAGKLYHLCATCYLNTDIPGTMDVIFYINGIKYTANGAGSVIRYVAGEYFKVGRYSDTTSRWDGKIEDFAIWNVQLTETEILQLYNSYKKRMPLMIHPANLQLYWPLDDSNPDLSPTVNAQDMSGNGRTGAYNNYQYIYSRESILSGGII